MARHMGRWPPIVWPLVTFANLLILTGSSGRWEPGFLVAGILPLLAVCALSRYLAAREWSDRARPPIVRWAMLGLLGFYLLVIAAAGLAGPEYAVAGLLAGLILLTALCLLIALARSKTAKKGAASTTSQRTETTIRMRGSAWTTEPRFGTRPSIRMHRPPQHGGSR
jgi:hypothetical protein